MTITDTRQAAPAQTAVSVKVTGVEALVFLVAVVPRLGVVLSGAGFGGTFAYDPSVYYAASDALLHGRMPYRDYVLLHPPGIVLALTPFAKLGEHTNDHAGFIAATLTFMLLGAVNAALVVRVATRMGLGSRAALLGGLFYAVWFGAVGAEFGLRLEELGNFLVLCGLLALLSAERTSRQRASLLCGLAFGAATAVKIWWFLPLLIVLGWHCTRARRRRLAVVAGGAAVALLVVDGPFFLAAPHQMWSMVVTAQAGRDPTLSFGLRFTTLTSVGQFVSKPGPVADVGAVLVGLLTVAVLVAAWRVRYGRLVVSFAVAQLALLAVSPSYFPFYNDYVAPVVALAVAAAVQVWMTARGRRPRTRRPRWIAVGVLTAVVAAAVVVDVVVPPQTVLPFPTSALAPAVKGARCVMSDSPMALIELNVLTRGLNHGCRNWVDVTGRSYGPDALHLRGHEVDRKSNERWQVDLTRYLLSGDRVILFRSFYTGIAPALHETLQELLVLRREGRFAVVATRRCADGSPWHIDPDRECRTPRKSRPVPLPPGRGPG